MHAYTKYGNWHGLAIAMRASYFVCLTHCVYKHVVVGRNNSRNVGTKHTIIVRMYVCIRQKATSKAR